MSNSNDSPRKTQRYIVEVDAERVIAFTSATGNDVPAHILSATEAFELIESLKLYTKAMTNIETMAHKPQIESSSRWLFPERPRDYRGLRSCVYFMFANARPGLIKIGQTFNLTGRVNQHQRDLPGGGVRIYALAQTPDYILFERVLHLFFTEYRDGRHEWFEQEPVLNYLENIKHAQL